MIPERIKIGGVIYKATLFLVNTREQTIPRLCTLIPEGHTIDEAGGEEYFLAYVPEEELKGT